MKSRCSTEVENQTQSLCIFIHFNAGWKDKWDHQPPPKYELQLSQQIYEFNKYCW